MTGGILKLEHSKTRKAKTTLSYGKEIPTTRGGDKCREDHETVYYQRNKKKKKGLNTWELRVRNVLRL